MNAFPRNIESLDWVTLTIFLGLVLLALSKYLFSTVFKNFVQLPFNNRYIAMTKKRGRLFSGFHILITLFQLISFTLFIYLSRNSLDHRDLTFYPTMLWIMLLLIVGFIVTKIVLQLANGFFFERPELMRDMIFQKISYFNYSALIAFLGCCYLTYIQTHTSIAIYVSFGLILFINFIGLINAIRNTQKLIMANLFYFILYLCTLEIAPLLIFYSTIKG